MPVTTAMPIVADLLDQFRECTESELQQLALDLYELGRFAAHGFEKNELPWKGQMQTSLHSCGSQLAHCPCGCRQFAFHDDRLAKKGLHGILVRLKGFMTCGTNTYPCYRHVHPAELALMNGMLPNMPWGDEHKLSLCALGQLASPIQSTWVGSLLMRHIQTLQGIEETIDPHTNLLSWMERVLDSRDDFFGPQSNPNAVHFRKLVQTRVFATKPTSSPKFTPESYQHQVDQTMTAHPNTEAKELREDAPPPPEMPSPKFASQGGALVTSPNPSAGTKRPASEMSNGQHEDSLTAHQDGGVHGFQNMRAKKTRLAQAEMIPPKQDPADNHVLLNADQHEDSTNPVETPTHVPHAMPLPRLGCGGPTQMNGINLEGDEQTQSWQNNGMQLESETKSTEVHASFIHIDAVSHEPGSCPPRGARTKVQPVTTHPTPLQAMPLPRLGCGGPSQCEKPKQHAGDTSTEDSAELSHLIQSRNSQKHDRSGNSGNEPEHLADRASEFHRPKQDQCPTHQSGVPTTAAPHPMSPTRWSGVPAFANKKTSASGFASSLPDVPVVPVPSFMMQQSGLQAQVHAECKTAPFHEHVTPVADRPKCPHVDAVRSFAGTPMHETTQALGGSRDNENANQSHPHHVAMPLPRLGCGGPPQEHQIIQEGPAHHANFPSKMGKSHPEVSEQQSALPPENDEANRNVHCEELELHLSKDLALSPTPPDAMPLPRLGCGGPTLPHDPVDEQNSPDEEAQCEALANNERATMEVFVLHADARYPIPYKVATDATPGKITVAEAALNSMTLPIAPRSIVGTHLPLDQVLHAEQYVVLHESLPESLKCPFFSTKYSATPPKLSLGLPSTRFEAL